MAYISPGNHILPPLPYPYDALEPYISAKTLSIHHDFHHAGYVKSLNNAELELAAARSKDDFSLIKHWEREVAFHGSGHILHSIYWTNLSPQAGGLPCAFTGQLLQRDFGGFEPFRQQLTQAAINVEGSGWGILVWETPWQRLGILTAEKHQNLTLWGAIPLLVLDVWEYAYYLDYQSSRAQYLSALWQIIDWQDVESRLISASRGGMENIP